MSSRVFRWSLVLVVLIGAYLLIRGPGAEEGGDPSALRTAARKDGAHYLLEVMEHRARAGQSHQAELHILPRGGYKVNVQYPTRVQLGPSECLKQSSPALGRKDALELTKERARFQLCYTPAIGGRCQLQAEVRFSVCNERSCDLAKETLEWTVEVAP